MAPGPTATPTTLPVEDPSLSPVPSKPPVLPRAKTPTTDTTTTRPSDPAPDPSSTTRTSPTTAPSDPATATVPRTPPQGARPTTPTAPTRTPPTPTQVPTAQDLGIHPKDIDTLRGIPPYDPHPDNDPKKPKQLRDGGASIANMLVAKYRMRFGTAGPDVRRFPGEGATVLDGAGNPIKLDRIEVVAKGSGRKCMTFDLPPTEEQMRPPAPAPAPRTEELKLPPVPAQNVGQRVAESFKSVASDPDMLRIMKGLCNDQNSVSQADVDKFKTAVAKSLGLSSGEKLIVNVDRFDAKTGEYILKVGEKVGEGRGRLAVTIDGRPNEAPHHVRFEPGVNIPGPAPDAGPAVTPNPTPKAGPTAVAIAPENAAIQERLVAVMKDPKLAADLATVAKDSAKFMNDIQAWEALPADKRGPQPQQTFSLPEARMNEIDETIARAFPKKDGGRVFWSVSNEPSNPNDPKSPPATVVRLLDIPPPNPDGSPQIDKTTNQPIQTVIGTVGWIKVGEPVAQVAPNAKDLVK